MLVNSNFASAGSQVNWCEAPYGTVRTEEKVAEENNERKVHDL
jgi:hypothetical protein